MYAFASSAYEQAAVLVTDSLGEVQTTTIGHACRTVKPCESDNCSEAGAFLIDDGHERSFRCQRHIGEAHILAGQAVAQLPDSEEQG